MIQIPLHPARQRDVDRIEARSVEEWEDIYRELVLNQFPTETRAGFQVAIYRPQAVPRMARVLAGTGHIEADPARRTIDTGIVILELIHGGFDSDRGQKMVRLLTALHDRPDILPEDMTYVTCALIVVPMRFIDRLGWRPLLDVERWAAVRWWAEFGRRIGIEQLPTTYAEAEALFDAYEAANVAASPEGTRLTGLITEAFASWMPAVLRPRLAEITSALIDNRRFSTALGLPRPRLRTKLFLDGLYTTRRFRQRLSPPGREPGFVPGQKVTGIYPDGYDLDQVGPPYGRRQRTKADLS